MVSEPTATDGNEETARWWNRWDRHQQLSYGLFCLVLLVALYLRFRRLGVAPLWIDEAYTSWAARNFLAGNGFSDAVGASSPYRRAWLTTSLPIAVSFQLLGLSEFAARLPIVVYSLGTVLIGWLLGTRYSRITGLFVATFLAADPFTLVWAREARMYAPLAFFYLASVFVFIQWYDDELRLRSPYPYVLAVLVLLGQNTHQAYLALGAAIVFFLAVQFAGTLRSLDSMAIDALDRRSRMTGLLLVGGLCAAMGYVLLSGLPGVLTASTPGTWPDRGPFYYWTLFGQAYPILRLVALPAGAYLWWRYPSGRLVVVALVVPFVVASVTPRKAPRYVYHLVPLLGVVGSLGIAATLELLWRKVTEGEGDQLSVPFRATVYAVPVIVALVVASPVAGYAVTESVYDQPYHPGNSDWEKASEWVTDRASEDAIIVSTRPEMSMWYYGETDYFFRQHGIAYVEYQNGQYVHTRTGTVYLNETADVRQLLNSDREVWLFAGKKFRGSFTDPAARQIVVSNFERRGESSWVNMRVYHYDPTDQNQTTTNASSPPA
ncbi:glycosyltransferase family 39 protein [Salinirubrum litoreum]|uniref:Glycosyltransferase family 39 protein n=1 Tax=Salinirubrum litoreum TaxID=1126234 RepID=A0ABD5REY2_9EURY|nr:glycosyltransferase family 39 protein [Salinirubrum litoreum]